jgi:hypothetical protein
MESLRTIMLNLSIFSIFLPILLSIALFHKLDRNSTIVFILLLFAGFPQLAYRFASHDVRIFLYNAYIMVDFVIWGYIFLINSHNQALKNLIKFSILLSVCISVYLFISSGIQLRFYSELICLNSLLQVLFILAYFYSLYLTDDKIELQRKPIFWFSLGLLLYAPVTYFHFAFHSRVSENIAIIHNLMNSLMYLIFSIGIVANVYPFVKAKQ